jgi:hypothetical protein
MTQKNIPSRHQSGRKSLWWDWAWWGLPSCEHHQLGMIAAHVFQADSLVNSEKLMKLDAKRREYDVVVIGEEAHVAYNRVGLTSYFQHRKVENLYLNPKEWVCNNIRFSVF